MKDKVEWEVVDAEFEERQERRPPPPPPTPQDVMKAMLGPWWRWKIAALFVFGGIALLFVAAIAGVLVVTAIAFALLAIVLLRVRSWWRGLRRSNSSQVRRR